GFRSARQLEFLDGEQVRQRPRCQQAVNSLFQRVGLNSNHVDVQILRISSAPEPSAEIDSSLDGPNRTTQPVPEKAQEHEVKALRVLDGRAVFRGDEGDHVRYSELFP